MAEINEAIAAQRRDLTALLADLPAEQWNAPTLCAGWRVREVVAHMVMPFRLSMPRFMLGFVAARGNFNAMADRYARREAAALSADELVEILRNNVDHPWKPPGGGLVGALSHDTIHGLDITVPLAIGRKLPEDRLRIVLQGIDEPKARKVFGIDLRGIELRADDIDWSLGSGESVRGNAQDLLLAVCGRKLPKGRLTGEPAARFTT